MVDGHQKWTGRGAAFGVANDLRSKIEGAVNGVESTASSLAGAARPIRALIVGGERMRRFAEEYAKHTALNLGQALQGLRYFHSHPDLDAHARRGSLRHVFGSSRIRAKRVLNDLFFAVIPPHWHHSAAELAQFAKVPAALWFQYGYCAWKFDETGQRKQPLEPDVDRRWDPRCKERP